MVVPHMIAEVVVEYWTVLLQKLVVPVPDPVQAEWPVLFSSFESPPDPVPKPVKPEFLLN